MAARSFLLEEEFKRPKVLTNGQVLGLYFVPEAHQDWRELRVRAGVGGGAACPKYRTWGIAHKIPRRLVAEAQKQKAKINLEQGRAALQVEVIWVNGTKLTIPYERLLLVDTWVLLRNHQAKVLSIKKFMEHEGAPEKAVKTLLGLYYQDTIELPGIANVGVQNLFDLSLDNWLAEDTLNCALAILYMDHGQYGKKFLTLPTDFEVHLIAGYRHKVQSGFLRKVAAVICNQEPSALLFTRTWADHYGAVFVDIRTKCILIGESCQNRTLYPFDDELISAIKWFCKGGAEWRVDELVVPDQGPGTGTCGIVAWSSLFCRGVPDDSADITWTRENSCKWNGPL